MTDVVVVGKGPAGISAALYIARANLSVTVIGKDPGALARAEKIENYFGLPEPVPGRQLLEAGWTQAKSLGAEVLDDEVIDITWDNGFSILTKNGRYEAHAVILATGTARKAPAIKGIKEFEGKGVGYCAVCDGFFYRKKNVAVLGSEHYALHEANELLPVVGSVTLLTNGAPVKEQFPPEINIIHTPVRSLYGNEVLEGVEFTDDTKQEFQGVFIAVGSAAAGDLARKLGAATNGVNIEVDQDMATTIPGLFAAGDCTGGISQVSSAVAGGARAAIGAIAYAREKRAAAKK
ncbi:MAG: NAD(P)/FAD-dependent oxidoreductase [Christensenellales bacterium]